MIEENERETCRLAEKQKWRREEGLLCIKSNHNEVERATVHTADVH